MSVTAFQDLPLADRDRPWDGDEAEARVRKWAGAEDGPNDTYRKAHVWYDKDKKDNFGSYKLLVADVIGGKLHAVPRGVMAAAAVMQGSRGGVDLPRARRQPGQVPSGQVLREDGRDRALGARRLRQRSILVEDVARAGAARGHDVVGVEEPAVPERQAAAADAPVEPVAEPLEHADLVVQPGPPRSRQLLPVPSRSASGSRAATPAPCGSRRGTARPVAPPG